MQKFPCCQEQVALRALKLGIPSISPQSVVQLTRSLLAAYTKKLQVDLKKSRGFFARIPKGFLRQAIKI